MILNCSELRLRKQELKMLIDTLDEAVQHGSAAVEKIQREIKDKEAEIAEYMKASTQEGTQDEYEWHYVPNAKVMLPEIEEPATNNLFIVDLPIDEIKAEDVQKLQIFWDGRNLSVEIREPIERDILNPIVKYMGKTEHGDDIKVTIVDRGGIIKYTRVFKNVRLVVINESNYDYSDSKPHTFELLFEFDEQVIERNNTSDAYYDEI
jgi:hypothetical protein